MSSEDNFNLDYDSFLEYSTKDYIGVVSDDIIDSRISMKDKMTENIIEKKNKLLENIIYGISNELHLDNDKIEYNLSHLNEKTSEELMNLLKTALTKQINNKTEYQMIDEDLETLAFIPPTEGTPAAEALAANKMIELSKFEKAYHKLRAMKRPKMKNFNIVKKLNKVTKQKRVKKHFSKNFKGKVIDGVHELYTLTAGIMLGVRCNVRHMAYHTVSASIGNEMPADFDQIERVSFPPKGNPDEHHPYPTPAHTLAHTFQFKTYAPKIFHRLRDFYGISPSAYMASVCGQFFFYSHDGQYMLKTQTKDENKFMISILPQYYHYLKENPDSLLVRFLGMHRIEMYHLRRKVHFVIMTSVFDTPNLIDKIYDLKGSLVGREASQKDRDTGGVLKDNDLLNDKCKLHLGSKKQQFMKQLEKDAKFLAKLNIMDYSLLVGIHDRNKRSTTQVSMNPSSIPDIATSSKVVDTSSAGVNKNHSTLAPASTTTATTGAVATSTHKVPATTASTSVKDNPQSSSISGRHTHSGNNTSVRQSFTGEGGNNTIGISRQHSNLPFRRKSTEPQLLLSSPGKEGSSTSGMALAHQKTESIRSDNDLSISIIDSNKSSRHGENNKLENSLKNVPGMYNTSSSPVAVANSMTPSSHEDDNNEGDIIETEDEDNDAGELSSSEGSSIYEDIDAGDSDLEDSGKSHEKALLTPVSSGGVISGVMSPISQQSVGVNARQHPWTCRKDEGINSRNIDGTRGNEIYYLGVIDILQQYNASKRTETLIKGVTNDPKQISSVHPNKYARRFIQFMNDNID